MAKQLKVNTWDYRLIVKIPAKFWLRLGIHNPLKEHFTRFFNSTSFNLCNKSWRTAVLWFYGESSCWRAFWYPVYPHWVIWIHSLVYVVITQGGVIIHGGRISLGYLSLAVTRISLGRISLSLAINRISLGRYEVTGFSLDKTRLGRNEYFPPLSRSFTCLQNKQ